MRPWLLLLVLAALPAWANTRKETDNFVVIEPKGPVRGMALCFSPGGDANTAAAQVAPYADRFGLLVVGSKQFKNGPNDLPGIASALDREILSVYHPDPARSFCTGLSGGGQVSYSFVNFRPQWFAGVIVNTCRINPDDFKKRWAPGKYAVMLASPTDFRYAEMKTDRELLDKSGWTTSWYEFKGGHAYAPAATFAQALVSLRL